MKSIFTRCLFALIFVGPSNFLMAQEAPEEKEEKKIQFNGDFRFRPEYDWNSNNGSSTSNEGTGKRDNRFRLRYRMRLAAVYNWNENIKIGLRFRTGVPTSIQSPHVNLGYKGLGMVPFNLDKIFFRYEKGEYWGWVGKNSFPFWKQNELFWDDDVLPEGLVFGAKYKAGSVDVSPTAAYFMANNIPVDGNSAFPFNGSGKGFGNGDNYGDIIGAQIKLSHKNDNYQGVASFGYYDMNDIFTTPELSFDAADETGPYLVLNYKFLMASLQFKSFVIWDKWPITLGYDFVTNMEDYEDEKYDETFDDLGLRDQLRKETTSHTASISVGRSGQKGDWQFTYYYAHKEMFSVVSYFTEDDWVRWGNIHANRNTNYSGHEFRLVYTIAKNFNVVTRFYTLEALERRRPGDDQLESGNRLRVDFNISF